MTIDKLTLTKENFDPQKLIEFVKQYVPMTKDDMYVTKNTPNFEIFTKFFYQNYITYYSNVNFAKAGKWCTLAFSQQGDEFGVTIKSITVECIVNPLYASMSV